MTSIPHTNPTIPTWKLTGLMIQSQWKVYTLHFLFALLIFAEQLAPGLIAKTIFDRVIIDRVIAVVVRVWAPRFVTTIDAVPVVGPGC